MEIYKGSLGGQYLVHHGIQGQKWGDRNGPPYPLDYSAYSKEEKKLNKYKEKHEKKIDKRYDKKINKSEKKIEKYSGKIEKAKEKNKDVEKLERLQNKYEYIKRNSEYKKDIEKYVLDNIDFSEMKEEKKKTLQAAGLDYLIFQFGLLGAAGEAAIGKLNKESIYAPEARTYYRMNKYKEMKGND